MTEYSIYQNLKQTRRKNIVQEVIEILQKDFDEYIIYGEGDYFKDKKENICVYGESPIKKLYDELKE